MKSDLLTYLELSWNCSCPSSQFLFFLAVPRGMWNLPRPGLEPVSPALAGRFSTTAPPGKPWSVFYVWGFGLGGMWDLISPPGIEPAPPALEGEVPITGPPGKSLHIVLFN